MQWNPNPTADHKSFDSVRSEFDMRDFPGWYLELYLCLTLAYVYRQLYCLIKFIINVFMVTRKINIKTW